MRKYALLRHAGRLAAVVTTLALASAQSSALAAPATKAAAPDGTVRAGTVQVFNVKDYGAKGDGSTNDSPAVNKAVTAANAAGGGVVEFPSGSYKSANTIHLKSNVTIQLDAGSKVLGSSAKTYDAAESNPYSQYQDYGHSHFHDAMFYGDKVSNVAFTGSGTIDGGGNLITGNPGAGQADKILSLTRCTNLTLSGITLARGGHFGALINGCDGVVSDHLTIATSKDRDGWNIISTTHVTITNVNISSNDDALVFKSDYALGATLPSGHVTVTHATLKAACCNALMFGSETCGSFTDYQFQEIAILGAGKSGLGMVSMDGADISDVHYKDVTMSGVHSPIMQKIGTRKRCGGSPGVGHISNVTFENVSGTGVANTAYSPTIWGADSSHEVSGETFTNVNLTVPGGNGTMSTGVPSNSSTDYNPNSIGTRPAYGWYLHNVSGIHFSGSSVKVASSDGRPAVIVNAGSDVRFDALTAQTNSSSPYDVGFQNVSGYCLSNSKNTSGGALRVSKSGSSENCAASAAAADAADAAGVSPAPVVLADSLLSLNKPATASSSGGCCGAANVDDGDSTTRWASAPGVDPQWIYVDLGATAHVSRVRLQWDLSCATAYEVDVSADHTTWTKIYSTTAGKGGVEDLTALDGNGRYVRVYGTKRCRNDATHGYSLQELGVYGTTGTDTTPPGVPGTPTLVSDTSTSVTIAWTAATDNVGVTGYDVYHDGQLCAQVNGSTLTATCGSLSPNVPYGFYVNARDAAGNVGQPSGTLSVTTPPSNDTTPPTVPGAVHSTAVTSSSVTLAWTASTDNVGVAGYRVYNVVNGTRTKVGTADGTATSTQVDGLSPNTAYHFQVTAYDGNANESAGSTPLVDVTTSAGSSCAPSQGVCTVKQVGTDDDVVWGLVTLPDGTILFNERDAHDIVHLNPKTGAKKSIGTVPNVQSTDGEGGLTGLELNPVTFGTDHWLYIMHTSPSDNRIVRIKYDPSADTLQTSTEQVLLTGIQRNKYHNGGRLRFSPDGKYLFAGTGDAQNGANAQNTSSLNGKVLRINPDGSIPADNPFHNAVWSYGHRNVQGLAFDSQGRLWEQEFGNSIMDETNLIVKGGDYGWPSCEGTSGTCGTAGFIAPKHTYPVAEGSCSGITIIRDFLYVACQRGTRLYREQISGSSLTNVQQFFVGTYGRLRTVEPAPDGGMWMATSNGGDKDSTPHNSNNQIFHVTVA